MVSSPGCSSAEIVKSRIEPLLSKVEDIAFLKGVNPMWTESKAVWKRIKNNPTSTILLILPIALFSWLVFGGVLVDASLSRGMKKMEQRLGADMMLVPKGQAEQAEEFLIEGARGSFYFHQDIEKEIAKMDGVKKVSAQFFLKSLSADCCTTEVELVFYHPETDFLLQPWIESKLKKKVKANQVVIGHGIEAEHGTIRFFGKTYEVAAQMAETGTSLDKSVYFPFEALPQVLETAKAKGAYLTDEQQKEALLSSVYINVAPGYDTSQVLKQCHSKLSEDFDVVYPRKMQSSMSEQLDGIYQLLHGMLWIAGGLLTALFFFIHMIYAKTRMKEVALFRVFGVTNSSLRNMLWTENIFLCLLGSTLGCLFGIWLIYPFGHYIGMVLHMPYLGPNGIQMIWQWLYTIGLVILVGGLVALYPTWYVFRKEPYLVLRKEGEN